MMKLVGLKKIGAAITLIATIAGFGWSATVKSEILGVALLAAMIASYIGYLLASEEQVENN
ncbi:hypothetical protein H7T43_09270 [Peribacillus simplex]|uniref:hypothetical protein n=1 Tax=Peribacillus simplex TaxID=1478 RepID=UPI002989E43D|nr:hypothetical protein [Peribacillus simplex]MBX9955105.1 hypothetical protein [Peribacillus simplex]